MFAADGRTPHRLVGPALRRGLDGDVVMTHDVATRQTSDATNEVKAGPYGSLEVMGPSFSHQTLCGARLKARSRRGGVMIDDVGTRINPVPTDCWR
jgi:hypothetical protein